MKKQGVDLGCVFGNNRNIKGKLCVLTFPSMNMIIQNSIE